MEYSQQKFEDMTWFQKMDLVRTLSLLPAITVMIFIRRRIGFRMLKPTWLVFLTVILLTITTLFSAIAGPFAFLMVFYVLAMLGLGLWQRWQRWKELCGGVRWHTFSPGISYLESLPLPFFLRLNRRVNRYLDPIAVAIVALIIGVFLSHGLGIWLMFAALNLIIYEQTQYENQLAAALDTLDGLVTAEVQAETVKHFEGPQPDEKQHSLEETAGIPTGIAPDIEKQIETRRAKRPPPPDNLAPTMTGDH